MGYTGIDQFVQPVNQTGKLIDTFYGFGVEEANGVAPLPLATRSFFGQPFISPTDASGTPMGTFYGFGVDELSVVTGDGAGQFDFSNAVYVDAGGFGSIPGMACHIQASATADLTPAHTIPNSAAKTSLPHSWQASDCR